MHEQVKHRVLSFHYAWQGIKHAVEEEPNFSIHIVLSIVAFFLCILLGVSRLEFVFIILLITLGLATELANTAVENLTDLVTKEHRVEAKVAKDVAAGMVLVVAIGSTICACIIFLPHLMDIFS